MRFPWRHRIVFLVFARRAIVVRGAFQAFVVEHTVRVHTVGTCGVVLENNLDPVANFSETVRKIESPAGVIGEVRIRIRCACSDSKRGAGGSRSRLAVLLRTLLTLSFTCVALMRFAPDNYSPFSLLNLLL